MSHALEILFRGDGAALGVFGPLVIAITDGPQSFGPANVRSVVDLVMRLRRTTHAKRLVYLYVAGERTELPGSEARAISAEIGPHFDACIGVHEGVGFRASAVRAVVAGISMLSRVRVRPEIVATIEDAAARIRANHADVGTETEIVGAIRGVRAAAN